MPTTRQGLSELMPLAGVDQALWLVGLLGHLLLVAVLICKGRYRRFPVFTALVFFSVVRTLFLMLVRQLASMTVYYYLYWALACVDLLLQLGVVSEIAGQVFCPTGNIPRDVLPRVDIPSVAISEREFRSVPGLPVS